MNGEWREMISLLANLRIVLPCYSVVWETSVILERSVT